MAQDAKTLARNRKNALRSFCKRQLRSLVGAGQVLWLRIAERPRHPKHQPGPFTQQYIHLQ